MLRNWQSSFADRLRASPTEASGDDGALFGAQQHRFSIYRDNMIGSLGDALGDTFPVTRQLLGERFFAIAAADFARREPPTAPRLSRYGEAFPSYLCALPPLRDLAYVADVALLEWARVESFFAGAAEATVTPAALLAQPPETLPLLTFVTVASLRVVSTATAALSIWRAHQQPEPDLDSLDPWRAEAMRVICGPQGVATVPISAAHAAFLATLQQGRDLTTAYSAASALAPDFDLQAALSDELQGGSLAALQVRDGAQ